MRPSRRRAPRNTVSPSCITKRIHDRLGGRNQLSVAAACPSGTIPEGFMYAIGFGFIARDIGA